MANAETRSTDAAIQTDPNSSESCTQTEIPLNEDLEPQLSDEEDFEQQDELQEAYRSGKFGERRGKLNFKLAQRWIIAHLIVAVVLICLAVSCVIIMQENHRFGIDNNLADAFLWTAILCGITSIATACFSQYFICRLSKLQRPLLVLLLVRLMAFIECILTNGAMIFTLAVGGSSHRWSGSAGTFRVLCVFLILVMIIDWITAMFWLFHWWRCCSYLQCFKSLAIFEPGEPLAEGVSDPRSGLLSECADFWYRICSGTDYLALV